MSQRTSQSDGPFHFSLTSVWRSVCRRARPWCPAHVGGPANSPGVCSKNYWKNPSFNDWPNNTFAFWQNGQKCRYNTCTNIVFVSFFFSPIGFLCLVHFFRPESNSVLSAASDGFPEQQIPKSQLLIQAHPVQKTWTLNCVLCIFEVHKSTQMKLFLQQNRTERAAVAMLKGRNDPSQNQQKAKMTICTAHHIAFVTTTITNTPGNLTYGSRILRRV